MARLLTQTLTLARPASSPSTTAAAASLRVRGLATKVEIIEIDLAEEDAGSSPSDPSLEEAGIRRLEEAIHGVMMRRAAPDWLPFVPGASFWIPPLQRTHRAAELMGRIAAVGGPAGIEELVRRISAEGGTEEGVAGAVGGGAVPVVELDAPMMEEQALCFSTTRGWPSASFFVEGKSPHSRRKPRKGATQTDDEES